MKKVLMSLALAALFTAPFSAAAAAPEYDIAKIPCKDFLADKANHPMMLMWIDGFMSAQSDNTVISEEWMVKLGSHLGQYCNANPDHTIMQAMDAMPAE